MIKILLFRHGETNWNKKGLMQGQTDIPLNVTGLAQAFELTDMLKGESFDLVLSSDLSRAHQTARVALKQHDLGNIPFILSKNLREINFGDVEGKSREYLFSNYSHVLDIWDDLNHEQSFDVAIKGGESPRQVINRFLQCLEDNLNKHPNAKRVAIFTHGNLMKSVNKYINKEFKLFGNCEALELTYCLEEGKLVPNCK